MNKFIYYFRKFSSYILFIFTLLSFIFTTYEWLLLVLISVAFLAFFKINFLELFKKKRYISKLEIFFSILLFIRIILLFEINIFYKVLTYFMGIFFILVYAFYFTNTIDVEKNILGIKKNQEEQDIDIDNYSTEDYDYQENYDDLDQENQNDYEDLDADEEEDYADLEEDDIIEEKPSLKNKKGKEIVKKSKNTKK